MIDEFNFYNLLFNLAHNIEMIFNWNVKKIKFLLEQNINFN